MARTVAPLKNSTWVTGPVVVAVSGMEAGAMKVVAGVKRAMVATLIVVGAVVMIPLARAVTE